MLLCLFLLQLGFLRLDTAITQDRFRNGLLGLLSLVSHVSSGRRGVLVAFVRSVRSRILLTRGRRDRRSTTVTIEFEIRSIPRKRHGGFGQLTRNPCFVEDWLPDHLVRFVRALAHDPWSTCHLVRHQLPLFYGNNRTAGKVKQNEDLSCSTRALTKTLTGRHRSDRSLGWEVDGRRIGRCIGHSHLGHHDLHIVHGHQSVVDHRLD